MQLVPGYEYFKDPPWDKNKDRCSDTQGKTRCQLYPGHSKSLHAALIGPEQIMLWGRRYEPNQPLFSLPWATTFPTVELAD